MKSIDLADAIREALQPRVSPYTNALLAVVDWCEEQREHGGTTGGFRERAVNE